MKKEQELEKKRHSLSHLLASAVLKHYPEAKLGMGPAIENGFYYDFGDLEINENDFKKLEKEIRKSINKGLKFERKEISKKEAALIFKDQPYKLELLEDLSDKVIIYKTEDFVDLCEGPHISSASQINPESFKLDRVAGAYFKGSEENDMLQRIYALYFDEKEELKEFLKKREEAKQKDHRKIAQKQELFMFDEEVGQGLPLYLPNGAMIRYLLMDFALKTYLKNGYELVSTPHIANETLWEKSGHLSHYADDMYGAMIVDGKKYRLKPMNCPFHVKMYTSKIRSYKELPIKWSEMGTVYRYEKSGELHGLTRPRCFTQDDAHIICTKNQLQKEILSSLNLTKYIYETLGMGNLTFKLSVRDPKNKKDYFGNDKDWEWAENALKEALNQFGKSDYLIDEGGAAFYAPKIDIDVVDAMGRSWQTSTIQIDFNLPDRFDMTFINEKGEEETPFMIHRALLGSLERFLGVYIEHTGGEFPVWLSPVQVWVIPISEKHHQYAEKIKKELEENDVRVRLEGLSETLSKTIRNGEIKRIPYLVVVGDKEMEEEKINVRFRGENQKEMALSDLIEKIKK